ncbi:alkaline phosphatase D family protein [Thaumasiovibrio subtropicus]|uniref:alkaline phosphatase D family protein n=1 Tax=Thaumasiovibrio subtropicus TaxID=1891207 RepID=UPI000B360806|nr:alkaline phosphatase D family protein [Thaumasiovibrio subtropicus]
MSIPLFIAGPILRAVTPHQVAIWWTSRECLTEGELLIQHKGAVLANLPLNACHQIQIGERAWVTLATVALSVPQDTVLTYDIVTKMGCLHETMPHMATKDGIEFKCASRADYLLHGSCRHPHHACGDALVAAKKKVASQNVLDRPALLMMSGDQIYADHVAGPMMLILTRVIQLLGLKTETLPGCTYPCSETLQSSHQHINGRESVLPTHSVKRWFGLQTRQEPIFSAKDIDNHLISLNEFHAMYLLVWSPELWKAIDWGEVADYANQPSFSDKERERWYQELLQLRAFADGSNDVRWLLSRIPTYMIFDDHDVTDDWNLTVGWEHAVYGHPLTRRIVGNALIDYWLFQGWGNNPTQYDDAFITAMKDGIARPGSATHQKAVDQVLAYQQWHYTIDTMPKVVVLDTRTRRWHSESNLNKPSGLMDWEALVEFQQAILNQPSVVIVSAAPMFGVKFIETLQKGMTTLGYPLLVDAENWMAHRGAANTLMSIFTHTRTPENFVILSGDVHYSFAYDVKIRSRRCRPNIYQITCSGFRNEFPEPLLSICEGLDRFLYSPNSPLNWLTKRKRMKILKRDPDTAGRKRLVNRSAVGELFLSKSGAPEKIQILQDDGKQVAFPALSPSRALRRRRKRN